MGLNFAIDELYATGWCALDSSGCEYHADGRAYPSPSRVQKTFDENGFELSIRHVQLFDCYRAEWRDRSTAAQSVNQTGAQSGAVVGQTETEAAVYALSQLRRQVVGAHA